MTFEDADVIAGWAADEEFCRAAEWTLGLSFEDHREFQARLICSPPSDLARLGAVHEGRLVGYVALKVKSRTAASSASSAGPAPSGAAASGWSPPAPDCDTALRSCTLKRSGPRPST